PRLAHPIQDDVEQSDLHRQHACDDVRLAVVVRQRSEILSGRRYDRVFLLTHAPVELRQRLELIVCQNAQRVLRLKQPAHRIENSRQQAVLELLNVESLAGSRATGGERLVDRLTREVAPEL